MKKIGNVTISQQYLDMLMHSAEANNGIGAGAFYDENRYPLCAVGHIREVLRDDATYKLDGFTSLLANTTHFRVIEYEVYHPTLRSLAHVNDRVVNTVLVRSRRIPDMDTPTEKRITFKQWWDELNRQFDVTVT